MAELPPEVQKDLQQFQTVSMQLQATTQQRHQFEAMLHEAKAAAEALAGLPDDAPVYRSLGALLMKDDKAAALARVTDEQETLELRVKRTKSQEETLASSAQQLQKKLQAALGQAGG